MKSAQVLVFTIFLCSCQATWKFVVNEDIKDCAKPENRAGIIKMDWEVIQEGEEVPCINGTWTMLEDLVAPWPLNLYTMKLEQGKWVPGPIKRSIPNFCESIHSLTEAWYPITKNFPKCPWVKGTVVLFDMVPLNFNGLRMTSALEGQWELFMDAKHPVKGSMKDCCVMLKGEVMDL